MIESAKNGEIKKYAPAFMGLGAFGGGCVGGVLRLEGRKLKYVIESTSFYGILKRSGSF